MDKVGQNVMITLNPYKIKWALYIDENNVFDFHKSFYGSDQKALDQKLAGKKGRFFIVTDKQYGMTQNAFSATTELTPNTNLSVHLLVKSKSGCSSLIPMTRKQFQNPIVL